MNYKRSVDSSHMYLNYSQVRLIFLMSLLEIYGLIALAGVAQWTEFQPANQRVEGLIPSLRHLPGLRPGPQ